MTRKREPEDGIVIGTIGGITWAVEKMKCDCCTWCWRDPRFTNRCIYGGPFKETDA